MGKGKESGGEGGGEETLRGLEGYGENKSQE